MVGHDASVKGSFNRLPFVHYLLQFTDIQPCSYFWPRICHTACVPFKLLEDASHTCLRMQSLDAPFIGVLREWTLCLLF